MACLTPSRISRNEVKRDCRVFPKFPRPLYRGREEREGKSGTAESQIRIGKSTQDHHIGETVLVPTSHEARMLGELMAGSSPQYTEIELGHEAARLNAVLAAQVREVRRELRQPQEAE